MEWVTGIFEQGLIYGVMALGVYIAYRILNLPDLTADGSFPLGAAVSAMALLHGVNPWLALLLSAAAGALSGLATGIIHVKWGVRDLLAGMIVMTGLYTVNLGIAGRANVPLFESETIFRGGLASMLPEGWRIVGISFLVVMVCKVLLDCYFETRSGFLLRAAGQNATLVQVLAKDPGNQKIGGLVLANALVAFSGGILCQQQRFFDIQMGTGTMVMGLASVMIGQKVFGRVRWFRGTGEALLGSLIYKALVALAIRVGLPANGLKLMTAVLFLGILLLRRPGRKAEEEA